MKKTRVKIILGITDIRLREVGSKQVHRGYMFFFNLEDKI